VRVRQLLAPSPQDAAFALKDNRMLQSSEIIPVLCCCRACNCALPPNWANCAHYSLSPMLPACGACSARALLLALVMALRRTRAVAVAGPEPRRWPRSAAAQALFFSGVDGKLPGFSSWAPTAPTAALECDLPGHGGRLFGDPARWNTGTFTPANVFARLASRRVGHAGRNTTKDPQPRFGWWEWHQLWSTTSMTARE